MVLTALMFELPYAPVEKPNKMRKYLFEGQRQEDGPCPSVLFSRFRVENYERRMLLYSRDRLILAEIYKVCTSCLFPLLPLLYYPTFQ